MVNSLRLAEVKSDGIDDALLAPRQAIDLARAVEITWPELAAAWCCLGDDGRKVARASKGQLLDVAVLLRHLAKQHPDLFGPARAFFALAAANREDLAMVFNGSWPGQAR
jgi:hypothetical protein